MVSLPIYSRTGETVGTYELELSDLAPTINKQLLHDAVVMYQTNKRQGSHHTRSRGEVAGSTRKMYRQKGTGNSRAGSRRTNIRRGGGHVFAKKARDYSYRLPRKALRKATRMAVAAKIRDGKLKVIDELSFEVPKTAEMAGILNALELVGRSTLVATNGHDVNVYKSARNIDRITVSPVAELNALAILSPQQVLITKSALDAFRNLAASTSQEAVEAAQA